MCCASCYRVTAAGAACMLSPAEMQCHVFFFGYFSFGIRFSFHFISFLVGSIWSHTMPQIVVRSLLIPLMRLLLFLADQVHSFICALVVVHRCVVYVDSLAMCYCVAMVTRTHARAHIAFVCCFHSSGGLPKSYRFAINYSIQHIVCVCSGLSSTIIIYAAAFCWCMLIKQTIQLNRPTKRASENRAFTIATVIVKQSFD